MFRNTFLDRKIIFPTDLEKMQLKGRVKQISLNYEHPCDPQLNPTETNPPVFRKYHRDLYFDLNGNIIQKIESNGWSVRNKVSFLQYNERNELTNLTWKVGDSTYIVKFNYLYFGNRIRISKITNNKRNSFYSWKIYLKDNKKSKEVVNETIHGPLGTSSTIIDSSIYKDGLLTRKFDKSGEGKNISYREDGLIKKVEYFAINGRLKRSTIDYFYDKENSLKEAIVHNIGENNIEIVEKSYLYENDEIGNWIKRTTIDMDDQIRFIVTREISYY